MIDCRTFVAHGRQPAGPRHRRRPEGRHSDPESGADASSGPLPLCLAALESDFATAPDLPTSGIEFDVPVIGYSPDGPRPDGGILPDVAVAPTIADIVHGRDPEMDAAAAWCRTA